MSDADRAARKPDYNKVLEAYVDETDNEIDLQGLVAYALYKRQKRDWIVRYRNAHDGRQPMTVVS